MTTPSPNSGRVTLSIGDGGVALMRLGPPEERVVSLTAQRLTSLRDSLNDLKSNSGVRGLVITGPSAEMFTVGADINLIGGVTDPNEGERLAREGQQVFDLIAALPFPTIAAVSGPCMGGGCELALACTYRLISDHKASQIGLPEVKLGILPGFGGTQRLPRLLGLPRALDIILAGKSLRPNEALRSGLVNEIVKPDRIIERATQIVTGAKTKTITLSLRDKLLSNNPIGRAIVKSQAKKTLARQTKGFYPAPPAALECAVYGLQHGMAEGLRNEARELGKLIVTNESKSLVHVFLLSEAAKALGKAGRKEIEQLHAIVIGAGVMGAGIAGALAKAECSVTLKDTTDAALKRGVSQIRTYLDKQRYLSESERSFIMNRIEATTRESTNMGNCGFAIEAIFEDLDVKRKVLGELAHAMPSDAIIASNTSSLPITQIAKGIDNPSRVVGMHFFNPVEKMPLVEVIRGKETSDRTLVVIAALATRLGKFPIIVGDVPGFLVNRSLSPYLTEAAFLLKDGYSIEAIDRAATRFGMPMGPIRLLDEVGLDVAAHVAKIMTDGYGDRMKGPDYAEVLAGLGRKGKKSGAGFYTFVDGKETVNPEVYGLLKLDAPRIKSTSALIEERLVLALVNEGIKCLDEGVAGTPGPEAAGQIDLGTVMGIGFPPFRGGLIRYAQQIGAKELEKKLSSLAQSHGPRFSPASGIMSRAISGRSFYEKA